MLARVFSRFLCAAALLAPGFAAADADGPDFWRVDAGPADLRAGPGAGHPAIGAAAEGADGLVNLGCVGGLSLGEWQDATEEARAEAAAARWCRVGHNRIVGWTPGADLREGAGPDSFFAGGRISSLNGSEWQVRDFAGVPARAEAWVAFKEDAAIGNAGCNRFNAEYQAAGEAFALDGPMAMTRMACPPDQSDTESAMARALEAARAMIAHHLVLALFDENGVLLATFTRRDAD